MVSQGITDYELYADAKSDRIIVRFPWKEDSNQNAIEAIEEISSTAQLTFRPGKEYSTTDVDSNGEYVYKTPTGDTAKTILMDGSYAKRKTRIQGCRLVDPLHSIAIPKGTSVVSGFSKH